MFLYAGFLTNSSPSVFQDNKADVILKYNADEARSLKAYGELPEHGESGPGSQFRLDPNRTGLYRSCSRLWTQGISSIHLLTRLKPKSEGFITYLIRRLAAWLHGALLVSQHASGLLSMLETCQEVKGHRICSEQIKWRGKYGFIEADNRLCCRINLNSMSSSKEGMFWLSVSDFTKKQILIKCSWNFNIIRISMGHRKILSK